MQIMVATPPITELTDRARDIFRRVVDGYLESGQPVGSKTLAQAGLNLSPASIRHVLAQLETLGLLAAPHTSAGRMPTDAGLRLFVDGMMQAHEPTQEERAQIEARAETHGPVEEALAATTAALSGLSACAGLVMVPKREAVLRSIGFVPLGQAQALAVLVAEDGSVENRVIDLPAGVHPGALVEAGNYMTARLGGLTLGEARQRLDKEMAAGRSALDTAARALVERGLAVWSEDRGGCSTMPTRRISSAYAGCSTIWKENRRSRRCWTVPVRAMPRESSSGRRIICSRLVGRR